MTKILKMTSRIIGLVILLLILSMIALVTLVSPNKLKPVITAQVLKYTGRQLSIDGNLSWSFFPNIGVKVGHMVLNNPTGFQEKIFAEIDHATVGVKFLPLLHAKIESTRILLSGVKLNLIKNEAGQTNWQDLQQNFSTTPAATVDQPLLKKHTTNNQQDDQPVVALPEDSEKMAFNIEIPVVDVEDAHITWRNQQIKQTIDIAQFNLHASQISANQDFPFSTQFVFNTKNPTASGKVKMTAKMKLDLAHQAYLMNDVHLMLTSDQGTQSVVINITGDAIVDLLKQMLQIDHFTSQLGGFTLQGHLAVDNLLTNPQATGHLQAPSFDLKKLLQAIGQDVASLQAVDKVSADFDFSTAKAASTIQMLNVTGSVKIDKLQAANLKVGNINIQTNLQNGVLSFSPMSAVFYQGNLKANAKVNLNQATPQISLQGNLSNFQAEPLLHDLGNDSNKMKVSGVGNIDWQVTTRGFNADTIVRNLNGTSHFDFKNGTLTGVNIGYLADSAFSLIKGESTPAENENATHFGNLTGSADIHNGVINNNDLLIQSPRFDTKGQGTIDLVNQRLDYQLQTKPNQSVNMNIGNGINVQDLIIPIRISGSLNNPSISLDSNAVVKEVAKQQVNRVRDKIKDTVKDQIQKQIPGGVLIQKLLGQ